MEILLALCDMQTTILIFILATFHKTCMAIQHPTNVTSVEWTKHAMCHVKLLAPWDMSVTELISILGQISLLSGQTVTDRYQILPSSGCPAALFTLL